MTPQLRPVTAYDIPALTDLWVDIWRPLVPGIDFDARRPWFVERIAGHLAGGVDVVLAVEEASGAILGFVTVDRRTGHLDQLGVAARAEGRGLGRRLLAEARARSPAGLHLEVNDFNTKAIGLYEREGFVCTGEGVSPASGLRLLHYRWTPASA